MTDPGVGALLFITVTVVDETQLQVLVVVKSVGVEKGTGKAKVRIGLILANEADVLRKESVCAKYVRILNRNAIKACLLW